MQNEPEPYVPNVVNLEGKRPRGYVLEVIRGDLPNAINAGLNQTQAFEAYKEAGLGANYPAFRAIYNDVKAQMASEAVAGKLLPGEVPLTDSSLDWQRDKLAQNSDFRYKEAFNATVYNNFTQQVEQETLFFYHNEPMTVAELQSEALAYYQEHGDVTTTQKTVLSASLSQSFLQTRFITQP